jgi:nondiscriminating glutamyl-tRNA synthetase
MANVKTRFAPSPTGLIHFGNVRTALFNALFSYENDGIFLLRIEDTDLERSREAYTQALERDLRWLGLDWQEGDAVGGDAGPYRQSERIDIYDRYMHQLEAAGLAYACFCTPLELEVSRKLQAQSGRPPRYSGKCAHLTPEEAAQKKQEGTGHTIRFRMPRGEVIQFDDMVRGPQKFNTDDIGDFIIRRSDGTYAFFFTNAIDDALMGVTHVMRGEDHLTNTPRQIALMQALGLPVPTYGHISLIVDAKGAPLSKRSGSMSVEDLRTKGYFPVAINNYLARLGHHYPQEELLALPQLASNFAVTSLGRAPARYDRSQLDYWQGLAVLKQDTATLVDWLAPAVAGQVPAGDLYDFTEAVRHNVVFPADAKPWAEAVYADALPLSDDARRVLAETPAEFFAQAQQQLDAAMDFREFAARVKAATGRQGKQLFLPLRTALTGQTFGPEMPGLFALIGQARAAQRLAQAKE